MTNYPFVRKDGRTIYADGVGMVLDVEGGQHVVGFFKDSTARKVAEEQLQLYQQRLKALASQLTIAEERERRRIAAELHDTVGQSLALTRVQIATASGYSADEELTSLLDGLSASLLQAIKVTRQIMSDLSPPQISELGLSAAVSEWLDDEVGGKHGLDTTYQAPPDEPELSDDLKALLFRNVRELLANVIKHAQASQVGIVLQHDEDEVLIAVHDDGIGLDVAASAGFKPTNKGGFGLFSIQERMSDLGGELQLSSSPGKGTTAILRLPAHARVKVPPVGTGSIPP